ncbi:transcriptional regulator [Azospirillum brasilense]|nr:transcriptional regulator [Azospirillum brasilense]
MENNNIRQPLAATHPHLKSFSEFLVEFNKESDRGMALIATAFIDNILKETIASFLIEGAAGTSLLDGFNAPLGSFSTRIVAAEAMGLISEQEAKEANRLRKIRNIFAHGVHVSFTDDNIRDMCANLELSAKNYGDVVVNSRSQFSTSSTCLILNLTNRPHYVAKKRLKSEKWPF